jgi:hypothetical protein
MKPISILIMLIYVILPFVCLAHPIESRVEVSSDVFDIFTTECPDKQGKDNCNSACCFAEHAPSIYRDINTFAAMRLRGNFPYVVPPQVFIPIFVPPQNIS